MHHIRYFLAVSETLNLTKAAERCNVAQPALSRAIQDLESELGGELLRREESADIGNRFAPVTMVACVEKQSGEVIRPEVSIEQSSNSRF
jgi:hypothetical protein